MKLYYLIGFIIWSLTVGSCAHANNKTTHKTKNNIEQKSDRKVVEMNAAMFKEKITDYTKNSGNWNYKGNRPVVIDFYATWCGPCRITAPIIDELAREYDGQIEFYKVDVDKNAELSSAFNIQSIPTFLFIPTTGQPQQSVGVMTKSQFEEIIKQNLLK